MSGRGFHSKAFSQSQSKLPTKASTYRSACSMFHCPRNRPRPRRDPPPSKARGLTDKYERSGVSSALLYSLIETAKASGLEPWAYLNHLFRVGEILSATLCSIHNIAWFHQFMGAMRESILRGRFEEFRRQVHETWPEGAPRDPEGTARKRKKKRRRKRA